MSGVYISYRRGGPSMWAAERLADRLRRDLGPRVTVTQVARLAAGPSLQGAVREAMSGCRVAVAVVGEDWLQAHEFLEGIAGVRRVDEADDPVRVEIRTAIDLGLDLIPVLLDGVPMPASTDLPEDVRPLLRRHSLPLSAARFDADADKLVDRLRVVLDVPEQERMRRRYWLVGAGVAALVVAAVASFVATRDEPLPAGVVSVVDLDTEVNDVAVAPDGTVWVADAGQNEIVRVDPEKPDDVRRAGVGDDPVAVAATNEWVWVANGSDGTVSRIDPASAEVVDTYVVGFENQGQRAFFDAGLTLVADDEAAWLTAGGIDGVRRIDASSGDQSTIPPPGIRDPTSVAVVGDVLWVTDDFQGTVTRMDKTNGKVQAVVELEAEAGRVVASGTDLWVASANETLVRVDADTGRVRGVVSTRLGEPLDDLVATDDGVWLVGGDATVVNLVPPAAGDDYRSRTVSLPDGYGIPEEDARASVGVATDADHAWAVTSGGLVVEVEGVDG